MTEKDAVQLLARWVQQLQLENAAHQRQIEWWKQTAERWKWKNTKLQRTLELVKHPMRRYWIDRHTPQQITELARDLEAD